MKPSAAAKFLAVLSLSIAGLCVSSVAVASDWRAVAADAAAKREDAIDLESLSRRGSLVQAWARIRFNSPMTLSWIPEARGKASSAMVLTVFDCSARRQSMKEFTYYEDRDAKRGVLPTAYYPDYENKFEDIKPDSLMAVEYKLVCSEATRRGAALPVFK